MDEDVYTLHPCIPRLPQGHWGVSVKVDKTSPWFSGLVGVFNVITRTSEHRTSQKVDSTWIHIEVYKGKLSKDENTRVISQIQNNHVCMYVAVLVHNGWKD